MPFGRIVVSLLGVADRFVVVRGTLKSPRAIVDHGDLLVEAAAAWATRGLSLVAIRSSND